MISTADRALLRRREGTCPGKGPWGRGASGSTAFGRRDDPLGAIAGPLGAIAGPPGVIAGRSA
ncbi:hypothetical protein Srubr_63460 [Streptomyces rubradiris]|uniref:Uncharacterized protein n=1 Tax=Streptomyces rubradiris TaxID=285531 RepID=A0ABQ3RKV3_STRRR|nr:hypothetical protein GCM10018792_35330 [Streptomyces rubradiris]GHI56500.1 hypothetical protein Srubr_63460 [Streptomyces rubradiris]